MSATTPAFAAALLLWGFACVGFLCLVSAAFAFGVKLHMRERWNASDWCGVGGLTVGGAALFAMSLTLLTFL